MDDEEPRRVIIAPVWTHVGCAGLPVLIEVCHEPTASIQQCAVVTRQLEDSEGMIDASLQTCQVVHVEGCRGGSVGSCVEIFGNV